MLTKKYKNTCLHTIFLLVLHKQVVYNKMRENNNYLNLKGDIHHGIY